MSFIGLGLGLAKKLDMLRVASSSIQKMWLVSQGLGDIAFTYDPYSLIPIEIQVYSQPLFATIEKWISGKFPNHGFLYNDFHLKLPLIPGFRLNLLRLCFRRILKPGQEDG
ncbi:hypothetical protein Pint_07915 [Pistacia integerrima]|uniref:Uncharacterized protein n=1 Tax=Pistacia integerrima TaxID=434235 RepID=A0ACC0XUP3_9ROSI|nr:hypothetical protein Pint_07915 [Pistacia integerrima]